MKKLLPMCDIKSILTGFLLLGPSLNAQTVLTFGDTATFISGTPEQIGAQYRYSNVGTLAGGGGSFDAVLTLLAENNGASFSFGSPRDTLVGIGESGRFRIEPTFTNESPTGSFSFVEFNISFVLPDTLNAVTGESVRLLAFDIDSQGPLNYSDVFGIQADAGGTYTVASDTRLVSSYTDGSWDTYRRFSLDTSLNLGAGNNGPAADHTLTDPVAFSNEQSQFSVQFDIENVGADGINFLWGMVGGAGAPHDFNNNRTTYIDGSGVFTFSGNTVTSNIPEPTVPLLGSLGLALLLVRRRRY